MLTLLLLVVFAGFIYWFVIRPWHVRLGATDDEVLMPLPGDDLVGFARQTSTRAITINAPPVTVWQWLVQIGQEKGGLYSYEFLENIIGCQMHNADKIVKEWQNTKAGDCVRLGPKGYPLYRVEKIVPNLYLLLRAADPKTEIVADKIPESGMYANGTWVFYLKPLPNRTTRLIIRSQVEYDSSVTSFILWRVTELFHALMEERMLRGIKERAEHTLAIA